MRPDLSRVTLVMMDHRRPAAAVRLLTAHATALEFGDIKLLNFFEGYPQSNYWANYEAWKFIKTDFALFVQFDGYVLQPELWEAKFLDYDFVGAPWPELWVKEGTVKERVGNDGFCLKSRRLLRRVAELPWLDLPSDALVCSHYRAQLEREGFRFAPVEIAARFSVESWVPETITSLDGRPRSFGWHGPKDHPRYRVWEDGQTLLSQGKGEI